MSEPQSFDGTPFLGLVLGGRYRLDSVRSDASAIGAASGLLQFDATDLSTNETLGVRVTPLQRLLVQRPCPTHSMPLRDSVKWQ
jgi:hypothetical protein